MDQYIHTTFLSLKIILLKKIKDLNRLVDMYLDYAEMQAEEHNIMTMNDWVNILNSFLKFTGKEILQDAGKISHEVAKQLALSEYDKYRKQKDREYISDFDELLLKVTSNK